VQLIFHSVKHFDADDRPITNGLPNKNIKLRSSTRHLLLQTSLEH